MGIKVRVLHDPDYPWRVSFREPVAEFDTFVEAVEYVRTELGPTAENSVIQIDSLEA